MGKIFLFEKVSVKALDTSSCAWPVVLPRHEMLEQIVAQSGLPRA